MAVRGTGAGHTVCITCDRIVPAHVITSHYKYVLIKAEAISELHIVLVCIVRFESLKHHKITEPKNGHSLSPSILCLSSRSRSLSYTCSVQVHVHVHLCVHVYISAGYVHAHASAQVLTTGRSKYHY